VSRITRGKISLKAEPVDIAAIAEGAVETVRPLMDARKQELTVSLPDTPIYVRGDAARLAQVVSNLLNNAAKFTGEGGHIWLQAESVDSDAVLCVRDTGIGIASDMLSSIFELFVQGDRSLDRTQGGLGIGLTLVRRLVQMHGGSLRGHSAGPNQGSEFVVRLPLLQEAAKPAPSTNGSRGPARSTSGQRILIVDDNVDSAETLAFVLRHSGHEFRTAHDGPRHSRPPRTTIRKWS